MESFWRNPIVRVLERGGAFLGFLAWVGVGLGGALWAQVSIGGDPRPLYPVVRFFGAIFAAQRTDAIATDVQLFPDTHRLSARTTLTLRWVEPRKRFVFLFHPSFRITAARTIGGAEGQGVEVYRLSWLTFLQPKIPLAKDESLDVRLEYEGSLPAEAPESVPSEIQPTSILLGPESFWYPTDAQSYFRADVTVALPRHLTLLHNSPAATRVERGEQQIVHWSSTRPIASIPLVAGHYRLAESRRDEVDYRLYLADDVDLDEGKILAQMAQADGFLRQRLGSPQLDAVSVYVSRGLRRGVNYGCGLIGLSIRYFRAGDHAYGLLAHELAHNWFGGTLAERWLIPGTGGQWLVEGWAELFSLWASEAAFGEDALTQRLAAAQFDPDRQRGVVEMSMLDNVLNEARSRDTIYRKGPYVAYHLCEGLGRETCVAAMRKLVQERRYQQIGDAELQEALEKEAGTSLATWFDAWVRSEALPGLKLSSHPQGGFRVENAGTLTLEPPPLALWIYAPEAAAPRQLQARIGERYELASGSYAVLDPRLSYPDPVRADNRYPIEASPLWVSGGGERLLVTSGEAYPWAPHTLTWLEGSEVRQSWELGRASLQPAQWFPDGRSVLVSYSDKDSLEPVLLRLQGDGTRESLGRGGQAAVCADGSVLAARKDRIVRISEQGKESVVVRHPGWLLEQPSPAADGKRFVYVAARHNRMEIRLAEVGSPVERVVLTWDRDRVLLRWAGSGDRLYAVLGGESDWQVWEIPLEATATRVLVRDAISIGDLAPSPDGRFLALTATPEEGYPVLPRELFLLPLDGGEPRRIAIDGVNLDRIVWTDETHLLVTGNYASQPWVLPQRRFVKEVHLADGVVRDVL